MQAAIDQLLTPRLVGERLRAEHAPELVTLLCDRRVSRSLLPGREPLSEADVIRGLAAKVAHWEVQGFGIWLLRDRFSGELAGQGGLQHTLVTRGIEVEAGWAIVPERWGHGLATEVALISVEVAFERLGLLELVAFTTPENVGSRRVMEKAGFVFERELVRHQRPHVLYRRRRFPHPGPSGPHEIPPDPLLRSTSRPL
jgi:ribosomal-protein-alanine N-acetyltransferase